MIPRPGDQLAGRFRILDAGVRDGEPVEARRDRVLLAATDPVVGEVVTVHWPLDAEGAAALRAEVAAARAAVGAGLVPVRGLWQEGAVHFLVAARREPELRLDAVRPASPERALGWIADAAEGVASLHRAGVTHGGVRPGRIRVTGARARLEVAAGPPHRVAGEAAPEVVDGGRVTVAADVYALGLCLYEALVGPPFPGDTAWAVRVAQGRVPSLPATLPRGVRQLLATCLSPDPSQRPRTAGGLAVLARRVAERPRRRLPRLRPVPWRALRGSQVLARDPATGAEVRVGAPAGRREAERRVRALRAAGWDARRERVAVAGLDWALVLAAAVAGAPLLGIGAALTGGLALRALARRCSPDAGRDLPRIAPPPPPPPPTGRRRVLALGALLLLAAALLALAPAWSLLPLGLAAALVVSLAWRSRPALPELAREARLVAALQEARAVLALHPPSLDVDLGAAGEAEALAGRRDPDAVADVEALRDALRELHAPPAAASLPAAALRRTRPEWEGEDGGGA